MNFAGEWCLGEKFFCWPGKRYMLFPKRQEEPKVNSLA